MMAILECYARERVDLGGGISYQHHCSSHKFNRDETSLIELGQRAMSHLLLSEWDPEQHAFDELEALSSSPSLSTSSGSPPSSAP